MNIHALSTRTGISLANLRKLEKLKVLKVEATSEFVDVLRFQMARNQQMTVTQLLIAVDDPSILDELGAVNRRYEARARDQVAALGDVAATIAPAHVTAEIMGAARGDDDAALVIVDWLKSVLPAGAVAHHWAAVRLLAPLNEFLRDQNAPMISLALLNARKLPEFAGWWRSEKTGTRNKIQYSRPIGEKVLDL